MTPRARCPEAAGGRGRRRGKGRKGRRKGESSETEMWMTGEQRKFQKYRQGYVQQEQRDKKRDRDASRQEPERHGEHGQWRQMECLGMGKGLRGKEEKVEASEQH